MSETQDPDYIYQQQLHKAYVDYVGLLNNSALAVAQLYDKGLMYVGGGALAVSIVFIEKIAPNPRSSLLTLLAISWVFLGAGVVTHLIALSCSKHAIKRSIVDAKKTYDKVINNLTASNPSEIQPEKNPLATATDRLSFASLFLVSVGIFLLCWFSIVSLKSKNPSSNEQNPAAAAATAAAAASTVTTSQPNGLRQLQPANVRSAPAAAAPNTSALPAAKK